MGAEKRITARLNGWGMRKWSQVLSNVLPRSTPMWKTMPFFQELMAKEGGEEAAFQAMARSAPYGRWALPEEVALAILYLASDESSFVAGTNLVFDNGDTA